ncbi:hypothetical protein DPMN_100569 [Dreissena polymorpha]|uniref:Uncharacterized protein n=1 Tax=Dreissena polymorpha TaxID=45954 RepID=A0A9D4LJH8_DREPO|nr:hypothetical protein DPMN_100569 [Dreissena polymorpha]
MLMELLVQNLLTLAIDVVGMLIIIPTSAVLIPSWDRATPKFLKLVTSFSLSPFKVMIALMLVLLFTMFFDLSVLTSILYVPAISIISWRNLEVHFSCQNVNFISESQDGVGSTSKIDTSVVDMESLLHYLLKETIKQDGKRADIPEGRTHMS